MLGGNGERDRTFPTGQVSKSLLEKPILSVTYMYPFQLHSRWSHEFRSS
jgi:hypothetical protein